MARRSGGGRGGRVIPGLHEKFLSRAVASHDKWHIERGCEGCGRLASLDAGEPHISTGMGVWSVLFNPHFPDRNPEFFHDETLYTVTGDLIVPVVVGD